MFKVTHGKVKFDGTIYGKDEKAGDVIAGLSDKQEKSLEKKGYGDIINTKSVGKSENEAKLIPDDYTVDDVRGLIEKTNDKEALRSLLDYEEANKNRSGVIKPLEEKIVELEQAEDNDNPADINVNVNPDELVED